MSVVLVVTSAPPGLEGGHLVIARGLERALTGAGHRATLVTTPSNRFGRQGSAYLANWLTDVGQLGDGTPVDHVISLRYPSYAVRHPRHVCWLNHTMREYYDLWDEFSGRLSPQGRFKEGLRRRLIRAADSYLLTRRGTSVLTISETVSARLRRWNGIDARALHPPAPDRPYRCDEYGDEIFFVSRLSPLKRVDLVLRALADPAARAVRCAIAGDGEARGDLERLAQSLGLGDRVRFTGRLSDAELVDRLARCRAVVFAPKNEDFGFVTVEAFAAAKAVITTTDSGGPTELVRHDGNGLVVAPEPAALAQAMAGLTTDRDRARRLGEQGRADTAGLTWPATVARLLDASMGR